MRDVLIAIDVSEYARNNALRQGATHVIDPNRENAKERVYEILPEGPDLVVEAAGPITAVKLMASLRRRGTRWNLFGITTHEAFELDGGLTTFSKDAWTPASARGHWRCRGRFDSWKRAGSKLNK